MLLTDYRVRILDPEEATAAKTRVLIESSDGTRHWGTVGVSENIIEASWEALVDSVEYKLFLEEKERAGGPGGTGTPPRRDHEQAAENLRPDRRRGQVVRRVGGARAVPRRPRGGRRALLHRDPAAERDRHPAHGPRPQQHDPGHPGPLAPHAGPQRGLDARHRPRRHRHAERGGARPARRRARPARTSAARPSSSGSGSGARSTAAPSSTSSSSWAPPATGSASASPWTRGSATPWPRSSSASTRRA